ncbi:MAG: PIN domain-containing protein [Bacteroidales bacterium]|nr:PIN domain-containing protein [Bacteroidales bacterium]
MKVFLDTNVLLDILMESRPRHYDSVTILKMAEKGAIDAYMSSQSIIDASYVFSQNGKMPVSVFKNALRRILSIVRIVPITGDNIKAAILSQNEDFEDAAQLDCSLDIGSDAIVSADKKMAEFSFPVYPPTVFCDFMFDRE